MTAVPANRFRSYAARLRSVAYAKGPAAVFRLIWNSVLWRISIEGRQMRAVERENAAFEDRYGTDTSGEIPLEHVGVNAGDASRGNGVYRGIPESRFEEAMRLLQIPFSKFSFTDYGAGKGKALLLATRYPFRTIVGVEWSETLCAIAKENVSRFASLAQARRDIGIVCGDATVFGPPLTPVVCFFFNPFDANTWRAVLHRLEASWADCPRPMHLVYINVRDVSEIGDVLRSSRVFKTTTITRHCWILSAIPDASGTAERTRR